MDDMTNILVGDNFVAIREQAYSYWPDAWRLTPDESITEAEMDNFLERERRASLLPSKYRSN